MDTIVNRSTLNAMTKYVAKAPHLRRNREIHYLEIQECTFLCMKEWRATCDLHFYHVTLKVTIAYNMQSASQLYFKLDH